MDTLFRIPGGYAATIKLVDSKNDNITLGSFDCVLYDYQTWFIVGQVTNVTGAYINMPGVIAHYTVKYSLANQMWVDVVCSGYDHSPGYGNLLDYAKANRAAVNSATYINKLMVRVHGYA